MIGARFQTDDCACRVTSPGVARHARPEASQGRAGSHRLRWFALLSALVPLSFVLIQCGRAPSPGTLAANAQAGAGDSFDDRFPAPQFRDRFPSANESFVQRQAPDSSRKRAAQVEPAPYRVASLAPTVPYQRPAREDQTALIGLKSSAFPYLGNNPRTDEPFLNVSKGDRRGHRSYGGRVYWQDETYNGNRVRGVFLLDAVYGELDKFASWIESNRSGFFVSAYTRYTKRHDRELMQMLKEKDIAISEDMDGPLRPGSVVFVETPEGVTHRDYVTLAWTENPVKEVLVKMAATPALTRMAASASSSASR